MAYRSQRCIPDSRQEGDCPWASTLVTFLKPAAWDEINGDTLEGRLAKLVQQLARPVRIKTGKHEFVALDYMEWKRRILRLQGEEK